MEHIGKNIKSIVFSSKYSAKDISDKLGVSYQYLYKIFNSENVDTKYLFKLGEILDIPVTAFFPEQSANWNNRDLLDKCGKLEREIQDLEEKIKELNDQLIDKKKIIKYTEKTLSEILDFHTKFTKSLIDKNDIKMLADPEFRKLSKLIIFGIPSIIFQGYEDNEDLNKLVNMTIEAYNKANPENPISSPEKEQFNQ